MKLSRGAKFPVRPHRVILDQAAIFYYFPLSSAKTHHFHANLESSQGKNPFCVSNKSSDLFDFRFKWQSRYLIGVTASLQPPCSMNFALKRLPGRFSRRKRAFVLARRSGELDPPRTVPSRLLV